MSAKIELAPRATLRESLARLAYQRDEVRLANLDLDGAEWLIGTHWGVVGVGDRVQSVLHGWFFGLCLHDNQLFAFENCGHRDRDQAMGRVIRMHWNGRFLTDPAIIVRGLHNNCHQLRVIDGLLCVVDTANQSIRRYTLDGDPVDVRTPFPLAYAGDRSGAYLHINSIARVGDRIGVMLHNGPAIPERASEIAWLDAKWRVIERRTLPGHHCHDIVEDAAGRVWHALSREGDVLRSDGVRWSITRDEMTRGIAIKGSRMAVGISTFGPRHLRGTLNGSLVIIDPTDGTRLGRIPLPAAPADIVAL